MPTYESSYPPNLYHASRPHSSRKSGLRLLANGRLGVSLRRFLTASNLLCLLWGYFLYWGERRVIKDAVRSCDWASWENWPAGAAPERVVLVADPQLVDAHTYPGRNLLFQSLTEFYVDTYMHRAWESIETYLDSDATIFLGDLFDGGREWEHDEWVREYKRFDRVFPSRIGKLTVREVAGNHDIGFGDTISSEALNRFRAYFGDPNRVLEIGNHSFVVLDTNSMMNYKDEQIYKPARTLFESVAEDIRNTTSATLPRILLTHIPLFRDKDASCGPKREGSPSLPISRGYQYQTVVDPELSEEILDRLMPIAVFSGDDHDACEVEHVYAKGARKAVEYTVKSLSIAMGISYPAFEMVSLYNPSAEDSTEQTTFQTKLCMLPSQFSIFKTYFKVLLFTIAVAAHAASRARTEATKQGKTAGVDFLSGGAGYVDKKDKLFRLYPAPVMMAFARYRAFKRSKTFARFCGRPGTFKREFLNRIAYVMCIVGAMYLYLVLRWKGIALIMRATLRAVRAVSARRVGSLATAKPALRTTPFLASAAAGFKVEAATALLQSGGRRNYSAAGTKVVRPTAEMYPEIVRDARFSELTAADIEYFKSILPESAILQDDQDLSGYNIDSMRKYNGQSRLVLKPRTTEEVSKIMKHCGERKLAVVPQGGNTGLVGGSVPVFDEIVISLANMNKIRSFDEVSGIIVVDAGCILEATDSFLAEHGYIFPLDLGAKGSCHIGGNVATNAGGLRLLRYGSLHGSVLGVEAVMADGTVVNGLGKLRKDNTGYDIKQLFIGSEGTLGVITGVSVLCPKRSKVVNVAFFGLDSYEKVQQAFVKAKSELGEVLSAFEFMDRESQVQVARFSELRRPLDEQHNFYVLVETSGSNREHDEEKLQNYLEGLMESEIIDDGVVAQDETQLKNIWTWREGIPESLARTGGVYKYDVSIPLEDLYLMVEDCRARLIEKGYEIGTEASNIVSVVGYGHLGDGNLHLNVAVKSYDKAIEKVLEPWVYEWIQKRQGSISAEHGLGFAKRPFLKYSKDQSMINLMKQVKEIYDPNGIMNPYKYI